MAGRRRGHRRQAVLSARPSWSYRRLRGVVSHVDETIRRKLRVQRDVEQPARTARLDFRHARYRRRIENAVADDAQLSRRVP